METKVTSNGVMNGGARIVVDDDDEVLSPTDLSEMLAEGTKESHDRAENCQFVKDFLRGRIKRELFKISLSAGAKPYVDRIHEVGEKDPMLLVAHSYTRYMGDLSGGQILKKVAQRALKLPSTGEGLNFYQFEGIHSHKSFKQLYRSRMNELEMDTETKEKIVEESNKAFGFNMMATRQQKSGSQENIELDYLGHGASRAEGGPYEVAGARGTDL
eukprot:superscaffoldBa00002821_g15378